MRVRLRNTFHNSATSEGDLAVSTENTCTGDLGDKGKLAGIMDGTAVEDKKEAFWEHKLPEKGNGKQYIF